ncbi:MAG: DNA mismatch repair endonuclease MutL [Clostridia bacterium]|nr:DNA mismatch repair endonuclease MutL [Clostridia bacterium]
MARINVLPKEIADLIAAGEVVERPSSVIKEFVENSIDAGSTKIVVEIKNGGKTFLRVTDDGCGIERDDVQKAFLSHATSKIKSVQDLDGIVTLGFRGEALASVCAVSKVEVMTCVAGAESGTHYVIEGGNEISLDDVGSPVGTTIIVRDLFYNIPARLKFLKKDVQEGNYIAALLERIAVSNPGIAFKFIRDGKLAFQTPGDGNLKSAVYAVFGKDFTAGLLPVQSEHNGITINGFITKPTAGRGSRSMQTYFVNGRYVKSVLFMSALEQAYKNSIMVGKYPGCVLFVNMPYESVDVNVHPAKTEVRFFDERRVFEAVYNAVLAAINGDTSRPQAVFNPAKAFVPQQDKAEQLKITDTVVEPKKEITRSFVIKEFGKPVTGNEQTVASPEKEVKQLDFLKDSYLKPEISVIKTEPIENNKSDEFVVSKIEELDSAPVSEIISEPVAAIDSKIAITESATECVTVEEADPCDQVKEKPKAEFRFIGEAFNTYLIAELENKIILIDKHAAHERILFDEFKNRGVGESQMMLVPVVVTLSADEYSAVMDNIDLLRESGYEIDDFGDRSIKLSACPPQLADENLEEIITELAGYLVNNIKTLMPEKLDWIYHSMACRSAVKAGNFTSAYEAERFVGRVLNDESLRFCPHGRPVFVEMTKRELEKQFKRIM